MDAEDMKERATEFKKVLTSAFTVAENRAIVEAGRHRCPSSCCYEKPENGCVRGSEERGQLVFEGGDHASNRYEDMFERNVKRRVGQRYDQFEEDARKRVKETREVCCKRDSIIVRRR